MQETKIKLELTSRQLFLLAHISMRKKARREKFGCSDMTPMFFEILNKSVPHEEIAALGKEWEALRSIEEPQEKQKSAPPIKKSKSIDYSKQVNPKVRTWKP